MQNQFQVALYKQEYPIQKNFYLYLYVVIREATFTSEWLVAHCNQ